MHDRSDPSQVSSVSVPFSCEGTEAQCYDCPYIIYSQVNPWVKLTRPLSATPLLH